MKLIFNGKDFTVQISPTGELVIRTKVKGIELRLNNSDQGLEVTAPSNQCILSKFGEVPGFIIK